MFVQSDGLRRNTLTQSLLVSSPQTNTLYLIVFESPESNWDAARAIGKQIMDQLALDDEI